MLFVNLTIEEVDQNTYTVVIVLKNKIQINEEQRFYPLHGKMWDR